MGGITTFWRGLARPWRWLLVCLGLYLVLALAALALGPPLARSRLQSGLAGALHRAVRVERVAVNPFTLSLTVQGLAVSEPAGDRTFVSCGRLYLNLDALSLPTLTLRVSELRLEDPYIRLAFTGNGTANFSDLLAGEGGGEEKSGGDTGGGAGLPVVLHRLAVVGGSFDVDDEVLGKHHEVRDFTLDVPFASSLPEDSKAYVEPTLSARVNGRSVRLRGRSLPFATSRRTEFDFGVEDADLVEYWAYAPVPADLRLAAGRLSCNASVVLEQTGELFPSLFVQGRFALRGLDLAGPDGGHLASLDGLDLDLSRFSLLERRLDLARLALRGLAVDLARRPAGDLDWAGLLPAAESGEPAPAPGPPFVVSCADLDLTQSRVRFTDRAAPGGFAAVLEDVSLRAANATTGPGRATFSLSAKGSAELSARGNLSLEPLDLDAAVTLAGVSLPALAPYLAGVLPARVAGAAGLAGRVQFGPGGLALSGLDLALDKPSLTLPGASRPCLSLDRLAVSGAGLDLAGRKVSARSLRLEGGKLTAVRAADGTLDLAGLAPAGKSDAPLARDAGSAWSLDLDRAEVAGLGVEFTDRAAGPGAKVSLASLDLGLEHLSLDTKRTVPVRLAVALSPGGRVSLAGSLVPAGPTLHGRLELAEVPLALAAPWVPRQVPVRPGRGALALAGDLAVDAGPEPAVGFAGDVEVLDLGLSGKSGRPAGSLDLARAAGLRLDESGARVRVSHIELAEANLPDPDGDRPVLSLGRLRAEDLDLDTASRTFSLRDLTLAAPVAQLARTARGLNLSRALAEFRTEAGAEASKAEAKAAAPADQAAPFILRLDRVRVFGGTALFSDTTLHPAVNLRLDRLTGLGQDLATAPGPDGARGTWTVNATVEQHAPLVLSGRLAPGPDGLVVNGTLSLRSLDLAPLNPYLVAYTGYPADTGRLDAALDLAVSGDTLAGENRIRVLGLELGPRDEAVKDPAVPIQLAMSILADSAGNLALDIPLSGRLDDPQFSLAKVVAGAVAGMVGKVVTAPFAFLGGIFSLVAERSLQSGEVAFAPGSADLTPAAREALTAVARGMVERPRLNVGVAGVAVPAAEGPALREVMFLGKLKARKFRDLKRKGQGPDRPDQVVIPPGEYERWLTEAYEAEPMDKPRNFLGLVRKQPVEVMERMLRDAVVAGDREFQGLAQARAAVVRDFLVAAGVPEDRVFLRAPSLAGQGQGLVKLGLR